LYGSEEVTLEILVKGTGSPNVFLYKLQELRRACIRYSSMTAILHKTVFATVMVFLMAIVVLL
jgi:hypothetical protein